MGERGEPALRPYSAFVIREKPAPEKQKGRLPQGAAASSFTFCIHAARSAGRGFLSRYE